MDPMSPHESLKVEEEARMGSQRNSKHESIQCAIAGFEHGRGHEPRNAGSLWKLRMTVSLQPAQNPRGSQP